MIDVHSARAEEPRIVVKRAKGKPVTLTDRASTGFFGTSGTDINLCKNDKVMSDHESSDNISHTKF
jgi:hypothetical protein